MGQSVKPGNWGDRMVIVRNHIPYKNISCAAYTYYCREDGSCLKTDRIPRIDGWQAWKKCGWFDLDYEYMDFEHMEKVKEIKGQSFFERDRDLLAKKIEVKKNARIVEQKAKLIKPILKTEIVDTFYEKIKVTLEHQTNINFDKVTLPGEESFVGCCLHSNYETKEGKKEALVIAIEKLPIIKHKNHTISKQANWFKEMSNAVFLLQKYDSKTKKYLIVPEIVIEGEQNTLVELYYKKRGDRLGKINLVEWRKDGMLVLPIGPIERKSVIPKESIWKDKSK